MCELAACDGRGWCARSVCVPVGMFMRGRGGVYIGKVCRGLGCEYMCVVCVCAFWGECKLTPSCERTRPPVPLSTKDAQPGERGASKALENAVLLGRAECSLYYSMTSSASAKVEGEPTC